MAHKRNHRRWLVTMDAQDSFRLLRGGPPPAAAEEQPQRREPSNRTADAECPLTPPLSPDGGEGDDVLRRDAKGGPRDAGATEAQEQEHNY